MKSREPILSSLGDVGSNLNYDYGLGDLILNLGGEGVELFLSDL